MERVQWLKLEGGVEENRGLETNRGTRQDREGGGANGGYHRGLGGPPPMMHPGDP